MGDLIVTQVFGGVVILAAGVGIFFLFNRKGPVREEPPCHHSGKRTARTRWEYGTRQSRWESYCAIGGAVSGYQSVGLLLMASEVFGSSLPAGMVLVAFSPFAVLGGLLAGLALGAFSSRFIPERSPPRDHDAG